MKTEIQHTLPHTGETHTYLVALELVGGHLCVAVEHPDGALVGGPLRHTDAYPIAEIEDWASEVAGFPVEVDQCYHSGAGRAGHLEVVWGLTSGDLALTTREIYSLEQRTGDVNLACLCSAALLDDDVGASLGCFRGILSELDTGAAIT